MLAPISCSLATALSTGICAWNLAQLDLFGMDNMHAMVSKTEQLVARFLHRFPQLAYGVALIRDALAAQFSLTHAEKLRKQLDLDCSVLLGVLFIAGSIGWFLADTWLGMLVGCTAGAIGLSRWGQSHKQRQDAALAQQMPAVFNCLSTAIASGSSLTQAFFSAAEHASPCVSRLFSYAAFSLECGTGLDEVLDVLEQDMAVPGVSLALSALRISKRSGAAPSNLLEEAAQIACDQIDLARELDVKTAQARMSAQVVAIMPLIMTAFLVLFSPDYQQGLMTMQGVVSLFVAFALDGLAWLIIKRQMEGIFA